MNSEMTPNYCAVGNRKTLQRRIKFENIEHICAVGRVLTAYIVT
jgi:hypothetical protein